MDRWKSTRGHKIVGILLIILTCLVYAGSLVVASLGAQGIGIFHNTTGEISNKYYLDITPVSWMFGVIWTTIYTWQALWLLYACTTMCRRMRDITYIGSYLYVYPPVIPRATFICFIINTFVVTIWLFLWDREYLEYALISLIVAVLTLYLCIFFSTRQTYKYTEEFFRNDMSREICAVIFLVHNGLGFFGTWVSIATLLNFATVLAYRLNMERLISESIQLLILGAGLIIWFILDIFIIDKYVRYLFTPYIIVIMATAGGIIKLFDPLKVNSIITAVLLATAILMLLVKIITVRVRRRTKPIHAIRYNHIRVSYGSTENE